ncbi:Cytoplasmic 60S subunit biogenesis factor REI1 like protein [Daldinia childiae]|uniref:Cytoplasmic 60S subunit biogenesis factor REI1 like protein n=1 Tax=Daldinia childiae TaxID=326645 RepID=UPI001447E331|nr:Cytoplasmic 60S subunit biogenesis factor REI1 like protein [Daldinia childiae]KAF3068370.1 Cytoplasmic 60S subunit biogenesis factor REI1 like protein [Daldinia childiae]
MATITGSRPAGTSLSNKQDPAPSSHQYTCNTCQVAFRFADTQKGHMKSDWHRYNLKRRVASLPPIASEVFTEKVLQARAATSAEADRAGFQQICEVCQRTYYSENSFRNHISSQKHKAREAAVQHRGPNHDDASSVMSSTFSLGDPVPSNNNEEVDSVAEDEFNEVVEGIQKASLTERPSPVKRPSNPHPSAEAQHKREHPVSEDPSEAASGTSTPVPNLTLKSCLFCNYDSPTVPLNVVHMERIHSMFIPEKQYLVDMDGLIGALQQRIQEFHECLYCGKIKNSAIAVQTHMRDKGHCKIPYTSEDEQVDIGDYYDFRSTYSDGEDSEDESVDDGKQNGGAKLGARRSAKAVGENGDEIMEDEGWETDSSTSSCKSEDLGPIPVDHHYRQYERLEKHPHHTSHDPRHHHQMDGWHSHAHKHRAIFYDDTELHLPSGRAVGHRSLAKYYRQNLHNHPSPEERAERLAIEAASSEGDAMEVDDDAKNGNGQVSRREGRGRNGAVVSRANGGTGMLGVTDQKKKEVARAEQRSRKQEHKAARQKEWALSKQANHQKYYNYQIL